MATKKAVSYDSLPSQAVVYERPLQKHGSKNIVKGSTDSTASLHTINDEEQEQFVIHINQALKNDADLKNYLPIDPNSFSDLYNKCKDGLVLR
jgi:hypothetical protein